MTSQRVRASWTLIVTHTNRRRPSAESLLISQDDLKRAFAELRQKGFIFTEAATLSESGKRRPIRMAYQAPAGSLGTNVITIGPFPLSRKHFDTVRPELSQNREAWTGYLALRKVQYEGSSRFCVGDLGSFA